MRSLQFLLVMCILLVAATPLAQKATTITAIALIGVLRAVKALDSQFLTAGSFSMQTQGALQDCLRAL